MVIEIYSLTKIKSAPFIPWIAHSAAEVQRYHEER